MSGVAQIGEQDQHAGFKHVLVATDFSAASERALSYSLPIVRRYRSELSIVHAISSEVPATITWDPCLENSTVSGLRLRRSWGAWPMRHALKTSIHI